MTRAPWPDTTTQESPPSDDWYGAAEWLLGRDRQLAGLAERIPGVVTWDGPGSSPSVDLDVLAETIRAADAHTIAWDAYQKRRPPPMDDDAYSAWLDAGPAITPPVKAFRVMSGSEQPRLRLLGTLAGSHARVGLALADFASFDDAGRRMLFNWCWIMLGGRGVGT